MRELHKEDTTIHLSNNNRNKEVPSGSNTTMKQSNRLNTRE